MYMYVLRLAVCIEAGYRCSVGMKAFCMYQGSHGHHMA